LRHPDALVLGGGIIGLACARELAGAGMRVTLLERLHQGGGASRAAGGMLGPLFDPAAPAPLLSAAVAARDLWGEWGPALAAESGIDIGYDRSGALELCLDDADEAALAATLAAARRLGEPALAIDAAELARRTPGVAPGVRRAVHFPGEHRVNNIEACNALAAAAERRGVSLRYAVRTQEVRQPAGASSPTVRVETPSGPIEAGLLVLAAGAASGSVPGLPALPVRPVRGQMALVGGVAWPWSGVARRHAVYFVRRGAADLVIGSTLEEAGDAPHPTPAGIAGLLARASLTYPGLAEARLEAVWAGLRPGTPDELPIVGWLPGWPVIAATGHYRSGILLAPWTARQVARCAAAGSGGSDGGGADAGAPALAAFSPARFVGPETL
jgi:glycine oxidase